MSLKPNPKSDSHGYVLYNNQEEIKQDREMNTNRMFKEKKINSVIRKQEGQLLRAEPLTPRRRACF